MLITELPSVFLQVGDSGPDNLLSCSVVDGKISELKGKIHLVTCPLIAETPVFPR